MAHAIWYTRCPVATASGIAYQRNMFEELFAASGYEVRNLKELGKEKATTHLTHTLADSCREGGALPPLTARQSGADTSWFGFSSTIARRSWKSNVAFRQSQRGDLATSISVPR